MLRTVKRIRDLGTQAFRLAVPVLICAGFAAGQSKVREVTFVTGPFAAIRIDGILYGKADESGRLTVKTVAPGSHTVTVRSDGFAEVSKAIAATQKGEFAIKPVKMADAAELSFQEGERQSLTDRQKAADAYEKAIKLKANYTAAYVGLTRVQTDGGGYEDALKTLVRLRRFAPALAEASAVEGRIYVQLGDEKKAVAAFKKAILQGKGFQPEANAGLGLLYKEKAEGLSGSDDRASADNYALAAKYLSVAIKQLSGAPDAIVIYQILGLIYEQQHKYDLAIATYKEFLEFFPNVSEAEAVRSFIVQINKQLKEQGPNGP